MNVLEHSVACRAKTRVRRPALPAAKSLGMRLIGVAAALLLAPHSAMTATAVPPSADETIRMAQSAGGSNLAAFDLEIPAQDLNAALLRLADKTSTQIVYEPAKLAGLKSAHLAGRYTREEALKLILTGSGFTYHFTSATTVTLVAAPGGRGAKVLGPVRVEGADAQAIAGINGSTDPTATEGTRSYTSSALSVASKMPQSTKDTPQSVSVITQQRMQDQNLTDFTSVMNQATGISLISGGRNGTASNLESVFYSRGFAIDSIQIDGGAPLNTGAGGGSYFPQIDMAQYDHVEILRGADGLFNGYGTPSGSVNLARKRPLDHGQVIVEGRAGSWGNYRTVLDATAPLAFDGALRGRLVTSYQDQNYFYDGASNTHTLTYGVLEGDLARDTVVSAGFSFTRQDAVPWVNGLPRYQDGSDLGLPRDSCLCLDWSRWSFETKEIFAQAEQRFGNNWSLRLNLTRDDQESHNKYGYVTGTVNPVTLAGPILRGYMNDYASVQNLADLTVSGTFELFGQTQQIVVGGNWQDVNGGGNTFYAGLYPSPYTGVNVFGSLPDNPAFQEPRAAEANSYYPDYGQQQWGAYANVRLTFWGPLHFITGLRYSHYHYDRVSGTLCTSANVAAAAGGCTAVGQIMGALSKAGYSDSDTSWPPKVSFVYDVRKNVSVYASYTDIYQSQASRVDVDHNPFGPITGSNVEGGVKLESPSGKLNGSIAAYRVKQKGESVSDNRYGSADLGNGIVCCYRAGNRVSLSRGVDAEVTGELLPGWQLSTGYTYNQNEVRGSDYYGVNYTGPKRPLISRVPKHLLKLWTSYQLPGGEWLHRLNVSAGVNAQTDSFNAGTACVQYVYGADVNGNPTASCAKTASYQYTVGAYAVFSARLAYQLGQHWSAALNVNNLTDRTYYQTVSGSDGGNWYGEPRSFMLSMRGSF